MKHLTKILLILLLFGCSSEIRYLDIISSKPGDYKLYIIPYSSFGFDSSVPDSLPLIDRPILIDNQETLKQMSADWILNKTSFPPQLKTKYLIFLQNNKDTVLFPWLDETYNYLLYSNKNPLTFKDSLIFKYSSSFIYLEGYDLKLSDVNNARILRNEIINKGGLITPNNSGSTHWIENDGEYQLKRLRGKIKPTIPYYKMRKILDSELLSDDYEISGSHINLYSDSITVTIAADSNFIDYIPENYKVVGEYVKYDSAGFSCIGLTRKEIEMISNKHNIEIEKIEDLKY